MKQFIIILFAIILSSTTTNAQDSTSNAAAETIIKFYEECKCKEIVVYGDGFDKPYDSKWLNFLRAEDGFLVFQREDYIHRWNVNEVMFIEEEKFVLKVFLKK